MGMNFKESLRKIENSLTKHIETIGGLSSIVFLIFLFFYNPSYKDPIPYFNFIYNLRGTKSWHPALKLISINEESLNTFGRWPWDRNILAQAILDLNYISEDSIIIIDLLLTEPSTSDIFLREKIEKLKDNGNQIILSSALTEDDEWLIPTSELLPSQVNYGHVNVLLSESVQPRRVTSILNRDLSLNRKNSLRTNEIRSYQTEVKHLSIVAASKYLNKTESEIIDDRSHIMINWVNNLNNLDSISFKDLIDNVGYLRQKDWTHANLEEPLFRDKIFVIGFTALGLDHYPTPYENISRGVVVNLTLIDNLISNESPLEIDNTFFSLGQILLIYIALVIHKAKSLSRKVRFYSILSLILVPFILTIQVLLLNYNIWISLFPSIVTIGWLTFILGVLEVTKSSSLINVLEGIAYKDSLTTLSNRRRLDDLLPFRIKECERNKESFGIAIMDIDHFKLYNDNYGHIQGDSCLREVSLIIKDICEYPTAEAFRYGGEEFCIFVKGNIEGIRDTIYKIRRRIKNRKIPHKAHLTKDHVTISIGLLYVDTNEATNKGISLKDIEVKDYINKADKALYKAKETGRDKVIETDFFDLK